MQLAQLRKSIDDALWNHDTSQLPELKSEWTILKPTTLPAYWAVIEDRLMQLENYQ
ncbi:hypothetical protein ACQ4N7_28895 [Nodosilinea sp. AN01ver1]|uniref:hypothetical protein n=1 Tax=Nodosilinea sp. AN01ver1 TaxID=3423362 RepID=UPI003D31BB7E